MNIYKYEGDRSQYLKLFLIGDEDEGMLDKYLNDGSMYLIQDGPVVGGMIILDLGQGDFEIKNISIYEDYHRKGYGSKLIKYFLDRKLPEEKVYVGTGDSPLTIPFYEALGFKRSHVIENFFTDNYDEPIYEAGILLKDMIYLSFQ